jgi:hypothetical protein
MFMHPFYKIDNGKSAFLTHFLFFRQAEITEEKQLSKRIAHEILKLILRNF